MLLHVEHDFSEVELHDLNSEAMYFEVLRNAVGNKDPLSNVFYGRNGVKVVYAR